MKISWQSDMTTYGPNFWRGLLQELRNRVRAVREAAGVSGLAPVTRSGARRPTVQARLAEPWAQDGSKNIARISEKTPPGYEPVVKALKRKSGVDNPWAVAWSMYDRGHSARSAMRLTEEEEQLQRFMQDEHDEDVPMGAFRSDLKRKKSLHQVMGNPDEREGILDALFGDTSQCVDRDSGAPVDCDSDNAIPRDEFEAEARRPRRTAESVRVFREEYGSGMSGNDENIPSEKPQSMANLHGSALAKALASKGIKLDKSDREVNFRSAQARPPVPGASCSKCKWFDGDAGCTVVSGLVASQTVSDLYTPKSHAEKTFADEYQSQK